MNWITKSMCMALMMVGTAHARSQPMEAQNRLFVGGGWTPGGSMLGMGFASRMTQAISIDVGAFLSPGEPGRVSEEDPFVMRHGLYVDPGIRIPHRNKGKLLWDVILRGGFGPTWLADQQSDFKVQVGPSLNGGADLMFRYGAFGVRLEGRMWYAKPFSEHDRTEVVTIRPQIGSSVLYTF